MKGRIKKRLEQIVDFFPLFDPFTNYKSFIPQVLLIFPVGMKIVYYYNAIKNMTLSSYKIHFLFLITLCLCFYDSLPQSKAQKKAFVKDSTYIVRVKLVRPQFRIDNRTIFVKNQSLTLNGLDAGVLLKDKLRLTLGYYWLNTSLSNYTKTIDMQVYEREIRLKYGSLNSEFIYKNTRFFSLGMPLEIGFGNNKLHYVDASGQKLPETKSGFLIVTDFGLSVTFKPIRWIGLKGVVGYRKTVFNQVKDFDFDGIFTSVGLNVDIREIVKDVQMFRLKKKYRKNTNSVETAVDLITD